jgi:hypothetical protein
MGSKWFYKAAGQSAGPVSGHQLRELANSGMLKPKTLISKSSDGPWFAAAKINGLFSQEADDNAAAPDEETAAEPRPALPAATKIAIGVCGAITAVALGYLVWFVAFRDAWETKNLSRVSRALADADKLQTSDPFKAYKAYDDILQEARAHELKNDELIKSLADADKAKAELYKKVEPQIRAQEAERQRKLQEDARRAEAQEAAAAKERAIAEQQRKDADRRQQQAAQRRERARVYRSVPESATTALKVLKKVDARMEVGMNYSAYGDIVGEAWADLKIFSETEDGKKLPEFTALLIRSIANYKLALDIWGNKIRFTSLYGNRPDVEGLQQRCWAQAGKCIRQAESLLNPEKAEAALEAYDAGADENLDLAWNQLQAKTVGK